MELLKSDTLSRNVRNCITLRKEYKETLNSLLENADIMLKLLNMPYKEAKIEVNTYQNTKYAHMINYCIHKVLKAILKEDNEKKNKQ